jgi:hypothetical protein
MLDIRVTRSGVAKSLNVSCYSRRRMIVLAWFLVVCALVIWHPSKRKTHPTYRDMQAKLPKLLQRGRGENWYIW